MIEEAYWESVLAKRRRIKANVADVIGCKRRLKLVRACEDLGVETLPHLAEVGLARLAQCNFIGEKTVAKAAAALHERGLLQEKDLDWLYPGPMDH